MLLLFLFVQFVLWWVNISSNLLRFIQISKEKWFLICLFQNLRLRMLHPFRFCKDKSFIESMFIKAEISYSPLCLHVGRCTTCFRFTSDWPRFLFRWLPGWGGPCHPRCSPWSPWTPRPPTWWATGVSVANTGQVSLSEFGSLPSLVHGLPGNAAPQSPGLEWDTSTIEWPSNDPLRGVLTWNITTVFEKLNFNNVQLLLRVFIVKSLKAGVTMKSY